MNTENLEQMLLAQIETLNNSNLDKEATALLIEKSKTMTDLTASYLDIQKIKLDAQRVKIEAVKVASNQGYGLNYEHYLGIEANPKGVKK